jgi:uracil-DNA glycosylase family 4
VDLYNEVIGCQKCERLVAWREEVAFTKKKAFMDWKYWGKPVPGFGELNGQVLVVGLAPGAHGSNRTGRMFTGDSSGNFLYPALFRAGFASQPNSKYLEDGLELRNMYITAVCRCVPPKNKPLPTEIMNCLPFIKTEIFQMINLKVVVALGAIAQNYILRIYSEISQRKIVIPFSHGRTDKLPDDLPFLISSYHPSRQNTQTGKLTKEMFDQIWARANLLLR